MLRKVINWLYSIEEICGRSSIRSERLSDEPLFIFAQFRIGKIAYEIHSFYSKTSAAYILYEKNEGWRVRYFDEIGMSQKQFH